MYYNNFNAPVAQLDRASDSDSEGRWFDSSRAYQKNTICLKDKWCFLFGDPQIENLWGVINFPIRPVRCRAV